MGGRGGAASLVAGALGPGEALEGGSVPVGALSMVPKKKSKLPPESLHDHARLRESTRVAQKT